MKQKNLGVIKAARKAEKLVETPARKPLELLLCSTDSVDSWSTTVVNPTNGANLWSHKGVGIAKSSASQSALLKNAYLLLPQVNQSSLYIVGLHPRDKTCVRQPLPAPARHIAVHPQQQIVCVAIAEKIYTYNVSNGNLHSIVSAHFQPINAMQFTKRGHFLVSAAGDGSVKVWTFASLLTSGGADASNAEPYRTFNAHAMSIDALCLAEELGGSDTETRIVTGSQDRTVKLLDVASHECLLTCRLEVRPTALTTDTMQSRVFIGCENGRVIAVNLYANQTQTTFVVERTIVSTTVDGLSAALVNDSGAVYVSDKCSPVTAIALSADGQQLTTGDADGCVRVWHVQSMQCVRKAMMKSKITTLSHIPSFDFLITPNMELAQGHRATGKSVHQLHFPQFQRTIAIGGAENGCSRVGRVTVGGRVDGAKGERDAEKWLTAHCEDVLRLLSTTPTTVSSGKTNGHIEPTETTGTCATTTSSAEVTQLHKEVAELKDANAKLVALCEEEILKNGDSSRALQPSPLSIPTMSMVPDKPVAPKQAKKPKKRKPTPEPVDRKRTTMNRHEKEKRSRKEREKQSKNENIVWPAKRASFTKNAAPKEKKAKKKEHSATPYTSGSDGDEIGDRIRHLELEERNMSAFQRAAIRKGKRN